MNNNINISLFVVLIIVVALMINLDKSKYQIASFGNDAVVIDKQTGEVWITDSYEKSLIFGKEKVFYLKPVGYCDYQNEDWAYKPDEKRNNQNTTWWIWLKRKILNRWTTFWKPSSVDKPVDSQYGKAIEMGDSS